MTPEGHNDLFPALEQILRDADQPLDCNQLFDVQAVTGIFAMSVTGAAAQNLRA